MDQHAASALPVDPPFLAGGGEMGARMRAFDWASHPLGSPLFWGAPLRTTLRLLLSTNHPVFLFWGRELHCFYNDAYRRSLGPEKHPVMLGGRAREHWQEIWTVIGPQIELVLRGDGCTWHENHLVPIDRYGRRDDVYWTYSYSPVDDEMAPGGVGGVMVQCTETTAQVRESERRLAAEMRWRTFFDQTLSFMCVLAGPAHRFEYANARFKELVGRDDIVGRTVAEALPEVAAQGFVELLDRVYASGSLYQASAVPIQLSSGAAGGLRQFFLDFVYQPMRDAAGAVVGTLAVGHDVTERVIAEREIRASQAQFVALADSVPALVWVARSGGRNVFVNRRWCDYTGQAAEQAADHGWLEAIHPEDQRRTLQSPDGGEAPAGRYDAQYRLRRHDGVYRWFRATAELKGDGPGEVQGWYGTTIDIDDERRLLAALELTAGQLRVATDAAELGIHEYEVDGGHIHWDARVRRIWGIAADEPVTYEKFLAGILPDDRAATEAAVARALEPSGSGRYDAEYRVVDRTGQQRWVRAVGQVKFLGERATRLTGTVQDISAQKAIESALRESDRRKDEFLATLSHELRNPLAPLRTAAHLLGSPSLSPDELTWAKRAVERQVAQMGGLLDDLLDVARITQGKLILRREWSNLADAVASAVDATRELVQRKEHELILTMPDPVPWVHADALRLVQILTNLLSNAAKYTNAGGSIELRCAVEAGQLQLTIRDSGVGLAPDALAQIFEIFSQVESSLSRAEGGLGVGLALSKGLVDLHGGSIEAHSRGLGHGSEFVVYLPVGDPQPHALPATEAARPAASTDGTGLRVLAVDDNADAIESMAMLMRQCGHEVRTASSGRGALEIAREFRPDVALLDIGLPDISGHELARLLRAQPATSRTWLIAVSGWGQEQDKRRALEAGFDLHLTKPADPERLLSLLADRAALRHHGPTGSGTAPRESNA